MRMVDGTSIQQVGETYRIGFEFAFLQQYLIGAQEYGECKLAGIAPLGAVTDGLRLPRPVRARPVRQVELRQAAARPVQAAPKLTQSIGLAVCIARRRRPRKFSRHSSSPGAASPARGSQPGRPAEACLRAQQRSPGRAAMPPSRESYCNVR
jgi:hypothetical protein